MERLDETPARELVVFKTTIHGATIHPQGDTSPGARWVIAMEGLEVAGFLLWHRRLSEGSYRVHLLLPHDDALRIWALDQNRRSK